MNQRPPKPGGALVRGMDRPSGPDSLHKRQGCDERSREGRPALVAGSAPERQKIDRPEYVVNHSSASVPALRIYKLACDSIGTDGRASAVLPSTTEFGHLRSVRHVGMGCLSSRKFTPVSLLFVKKTTLYGVLHQSNPCGSTRTGQHQTHFPAARALSAEAECLPAVRVRAPLYRMKS